MTVVFAQLSIVLEWIILAKSVKVWATIAVIGRLLMKTSGHTANDDAHTTQTMARGSVWPDLVQLGLLLSVACDLLLGLNWVTT